MLLSLGYMVREGTTRKLECSKSEEGQVIFVLFLALRTRCCFESKSEESASGSKFQFGQAGTLGKTQGKGTVMWREPKLDKNASSRAESALREPWGLGVDISS